MAIDYFLLVFAATIGAIQVGASIGRLDGLLVVRSPILARVLGIALIIAAFVWFFSTGERNINDYNGGLDANQQALFFFLGAIGGGIFTLVTTSLVNLRMHRDDPPPGAGLDALKETSYLNALRLSIRYWWKNWRSQIKNYFSG